MQKKRKQDKAVEGTHLALPTASSPSNSDIDKNSGVELKHKVHRTIFGS